MTNASIDDFFQRSFVGGTLIRCDLFNTSDGFGARGTITSFSASHGRLHVKTDQSGLGLVATVSRVTVHSAYSGVYIVDPGWNPPAGNYVFVEPEARVPTHYNDLVPYLRAKV